MSQYGFTVCKTLINGDEKIKLIFRSFSRYLSLLASCTNKKVREMHKQCLVHLLSVACPKCETLKTVEIIKSKRKTSPMLLPALGALVRQSATVETLKLTSCEIPNIIKKSNKCD